MEFCEDYTGRAVLCNFDEMRWIITLFLEALDLSHYVLRYPRFVLTATVEEILEKIPLIITEEYFLYVTSRFGDRCFAIFISYVLNKQRVL